MDPPAQVPPAGDIADGGEPPLVIHIPRRLYLEEFSAHTGLAHKYSSVTDEDGLVRACVVVDVPQVPGMPLEKTRAFYGERKGDLDSAIDSAAEVALGHLCDDYGFAFDDWSYSHLVEARESLRVALESLREMHAELEAAQQEEIWAKQQLDGLRNICLEFADLWPVRAGGPSGIEYVGPASPTGEHDQLALGLVELLQSAYVE